MVQTGEVQQIESAMDEQLVQMDIERKIAQLPLYDRYIVKLKMSEAAVFSNETPMESIGANIDAAIPAAKSTANAQVRAVLSEKASGGNCTFRPYHNANIHRGGTIARAFDGLAFPKSRRGSVYSRTSQ